MSVVPVCNILFCQLLFACYFDTLNYTISSLMIELHIYPIHYSDTYPHVDPSSLFFVLHLAYSTPKKKNKEKSRSSLLPHRTCEFY